jgi:DNA (cytosine-5)-methyltransferase 1
MLDLFSGIGGFHKGFEQAGYEFDWVGFSEIDKYASAVYRHRFPEAVELGDITAIQPGRDLPDHIDILCGGFPCQAFSVAGKRKGFDDTRGTLFFEIARLLRHYRETESPIDYFLLENVKGLLSHDNGRTFATIYGVLSDLGYTVEFQLLNTRWWLPQNRERIYLVGYIGDRSGQSVFPIGETSKSDNELNINVIGTTLNTNAEGTNSRHWIYDSGGIMGSLSATDYKQPKQIRTIGKDSEATTGQDQHGVMVKQYGQKSLNETLEKENLKEDDVKALDLYNKKAQDISPTLTEPHHNSLRLYERSQIRRLTPVECCRLQGFPDAWNEFGEFDGKVVPMSDTQRYKQCGNAVTVNVVQAVAERIGEMK